MVKRNKVARSSLKNILRLISHNFPFTPKEMYHFMLKIDHVPDNIVKFTVNQFYIQGHFETKPIAYLGAVIANYNKNSDKLKEIEKKKYGSKPPYIEI